MYLDPPARPPIGQYRIVGFTTSDDLGPDAIIHILQHAAEAAGVTLRIEGWERIGNDKRPQPHTADLTRVARVASASIDYDENDGDYRESLDTILHIVTGGARGRDWGRGHTDPEGSN